MALEYGVRPVSFIQYDGANSQEIYDALVASFGPDYPVVVVNSTPTVLSLTVDLGFTVREPILNVGDRISISDQNLYVVAPSEWATYAKP